MIAAGASIGYGTPLTLTDTSNKIKRGTKGDSSVLKPTLMTAVPAILDRVRDGVRKNVTSINYLFGSFVCFFCACMSYNCVDEPQSGYEHKLRSNRYSYKLMLIGGVCEMCPGKFQFQLRPCIFFQIFLQLNITLGLV